MSVTSAGRKSSSVYRSKWPTEYSGGVKGKSADGLDRFLLRFISEPDVDVPFNSIQGVEDNDFTFEGVLIRQENGTAVVKNPKLFVIKDGADPDRYDGVLNAFKSGKGQLPEEAPGVIWIRIPAPKNRPEMIRNLEQMAKRIHSELSGDNNRRVNAVNLSIRYFSDEPNGELQAKTYKEQSNWVTHDNPRHPI